MAVFERYRFVSAVGVVECFGSTDAGIGWAIHERAEGVSAEVAELELQALRAEFPPDWRHDGLEYVPSETELAARLAAYDRGTGIQVVQAPEFNPNVVY